MKIRQIITAKKFFHLCLAGMSLIFLSESFSLAQVFTGSFKEKTEKDIIGERIIETDSSSYTREREIILRQLEIITGDEENRYIIVPGDTLNINFRDRASVNEGVYQVSNAGEIHLPLVGKLNVAGNTRQQARKKINNALKVFIRYPSSEVFVNISGRYMVSGQVLSPGVFRIRPNLSMMEAVLGASYDKESARLNSIILVRGNYENPVVTRINLLKMIRKGDMSDNIIVKPGDFIYVPKSYIGNIEKFISTVYRYVKAYYSYGRIPQEPGEPDRVFFE